MKVLFIKAKRKINNDMNIDKILEIPGKLAIFYSIQYQDVAKYIFSELKKKNKAVFLQQVLGCSALNKKELEKVDSILLFSSGRFHALNIALQTEKQFYIYNSSIIEKLSDEEIENFKKKRKAAVLKFLLAEKIGILVSTKPGQENLQAALKLKENLIKIDKKGFIFASDNINIAELENFPIQSWVNTACPGLYLDIQSILNVDEIEDFLK